MMRAASHVFAALMVVFMLGPLFIVVWMSFTPSAAFTLPVHEFSLQWYRAVFTYPGFVDGFLLSLRLALCTATASTILGFLAAYGLLRFRLRGRRLLEAFFASPLLVPAIAFGIAMLQFINGLDLYNSFWSLLAAHLVVTAPFSIRASSAAIRGVPREVEWAAGNLGANWWRTLLGVTLPMSFRGTLAGFIFAFVVSFDELTVSVFVAGPGYRTLPIRIYNYLTDQIDPTVVALSALLVLLSILLIVALEFGMGLRQLVR
jgi:putative spermidine/putrescine transport system permease protein